MKITSVLLGAALGLVAAHAPARAQVYEYDHTGNMVVRHAGLVLQTHYEFETAFRDRGNALDFKYTFQAKHPTSDSMSEGRVYGTWAEEFNHFSITGASIGSEELIPARGRCELQRTGSPFSNDYNLRSLACQVEFSDTDVMVIQAVVNTTTLPPGLENVSTEGGNQL